MDNKELFSNLTDFTQYAEGLLADTTFEQLRPSIMAVSYEITDIITSEVYDEIVKGESDIPLILLKSAVATGALYKYAIFAAVKRNGGDNSLYKYQFEEIKQHHIDAHWKAMDRLLLWLDEHADEVKWSETEQYKERQELPVRSAVEFDYYFGIDRSSYFFSKVQYLIRAIWKMKIQPVIRDTQDETVRDLAKRSLCYQVMARAVMQFDVTELPRSIRYDYNHEYTKGSNMQSRDKLYAQLMADVDSMNSSIDSILKLSSGASALQTNTNREENKHYTIL